MSLCPAGEPRGGGTRPQETGRRSVAAGPNERVRREFRPDLSEVRGPDADLRAQRGARRPVHRVPRIFLDRGELERLVDAETSHYGQPAAAPAQRAPERDDRDRDGYGKKKKSKASFLGDLFEM